MTRLILSGRAVTVEAVKGRAEIVVTIDDDVLIVSDLGAYQLAKALLVESCDGAHTTKYKSGRKPKRIKS